MTTLIKLSLTNVSLDLLIATAVSQTQAALFAGKHEITAVFEYQGVTFQVKPDSDPDFLAGAFHALPPGSHERVIGPYACNGVVNEI